MHHRIQRVLLLHTDSYYLIKPVYPYGLDTIANHLRRRGYEVAIDYPFLPDPDPKVNLTEIIARTVPDLIGVGIRNIDTTMSCEQFGNVKGAGYRAMYFLPMVRQFVEMIKKIAPDVPLVAGGGAFAISPKNILDYLGIDFGVTGTGEEPLLEFLKAYPDKNRLTRISGLVYRSGDKIRSNPHKPFFLRKTNVLLIETISLLMPLKRRACRCK